VSASIQLRSVAFVLLLAAPSTRVVLAAASGPPTPEDLHPDTGPDPGSCEALRSCTPVIK
jgi:hypothetical protein